MTKTNHPTSEQYVREARTGQLVAIVKGTAVTDSSRLPGLALAELVRRGYKF